MLPAGNFSSVGMKGVTSLRRAVFSGTSPMVRRRKTASSEEIDARRRSLSTNRLEKSDRSDSWTNVFVGQSRCRRYSTLSASSVENLATLDPEKDVFERRSTFVDSHKCRSTEECRRIYFGKSNRRKRYLLSIPRLFNEPNVGCY